ncbi:site-specific DNA-methyltransferase [Sphingobium sp. WW5]|uniref:site-specific DNA-methyltransferase n=1 Tax=unclassified Sphingobium TaxID=2611147 RepID=UPI003C1A53A5
MTDAANEQPNPFDLNSDDVAARKRDELMQLFPEAFSDGKIDFGQLRRVLGEWVDEGTERFGLSWPGKAACMKVIQAPATGALRPDLEESVNFDESDNIFVEGDNLEVLKLLQKAYFGKVKVIYIDPPYNTGKEFVYPDKYSETLETYLSYTGQKDDEGRRFSTNSESSGRFHSRWLNMIFPRLYIARNLLSDDGIIFISIDDNEHAHLKTLCDQIFGSENFLGSVCRATGQTTGQDSGGLGSSFDYLLVYGRNPEVDLSGLPLTNKDLLRFENEDERGKYAFDQMRKTGSNDRREDRPNLFYPVINPDGEETWPIASAGYESRWRFGYETYSRLRDDNFIVWKKALRGDSEIWWPYVKYYADGRTKRPSPLWNDLDGNKKAARDVRALFGGKKVFDFPKPVPMIQRCIQIAPNASSSDIILDFFAGSASTAEAVMDLNARDGGSRRFILVQLPEPTDEGSEARAIGISNLASLARQRIRLAAEKIVRGIPANDGADLGLSKKTDFGFRAFNLGQSAFPKWEVESEVEQNDLLDSIADHASYGVDASDDAILFELLLKDGFQLTERVNKVSIANSKVYSIADGALLICLERNLSKEIIDALADLAEEKEAARVVCLDVGFQGNDQLKTNAVQTFKSRLGHGEDGSMFRTV